MREFNYDLAPTEFPVTIGEKKYILREASEEAARQWRNAAANTAKFSSDGKVMSVGNIADSQMLLVSLCLCETNERGEVKTKSNGDVVTVGKSFIGSLPARVVKDLFEQIKESSDLNETDTKERKALLTAFDRADAPGTLDSLRSWAKAIQEEDSGAYSALYRMVKEDESERVLKNGSRYMKATSH